MLKIRSDNYLNKMFNLRGLNTLCVGLALLACLVHCDVIRKPEIHSVDIRATDVQTETSPPTTDAPQETTTMNVVPAADRKVVCYYASWANYRTGDGSCKVEDIDPNICTHAIYTFALLANNKITIADSWLELPDGLDAYNRFVKLKNTNPDLKTTIAIGGWNEGSIDFSAMASSSANRNTFIQSVVDFLELYKFDGLDLAWEYPTQRGGQPEDRENFALLITEMRQASCTYNINY